jgi:hypothetical protein
LDLTGDILLLKQETSGCESRLTVELRNDGAGFAALPEPLHIGCSLEFSWGYATTAGSETGGMQSCTLEACEYIDTGASSKLVMYAVNGWGKVIRWVAKQQFRWNMNPGEASVKDIMTFVLARAGLRLEVISESEGITTFCPDFTINPDARGDSVIKKLLSCVPDLLFIEGDAACLVNPSADDNSVYSYAAPQIDGIHPILAGRYRTEAPSYNHIQLEGFDSVGRQALLINCYDYSDLENSGERYLAIDDINIGSVEAGEDRGEAALRRSSMEAAGGYIEIHPNCGQQVYDVIDITDKKAGMANERRRIFGLQTIFNPAGGKYTQILGLGNV